MAKPTNVKQCPGCHGRMMVEKRDGTPVVCPLCEGTGRRTFYDRLPRWYIINSTIAAALGFINGALAIDAVADFELIWLCRTSSTGVFTAEFTDASGRAWQNLPVNDLNMFGTAVAPFPVGLSPVVLRGSSSLIFRLVDLSGIAGNAIQLALVGYDLYLTE